MKQNLKRGTYVTRSAYQKVCEQNKRLLYDIIVLVKEGPPTMEKIQTITKWRDKFKKEKQFNSVIKEMARIFLKDHPEYDIAKGHTGKLDSNPKAFQ